MSPFKGAQDVSAPQNGEARRRIAYAVAMVAVGKQRGLGQKGSRLGPVNGQPAAIGERPDQRNGTFQNEEGAAHRVVPMKDAAAAREGSARSRREQL